MLREQTGLNIERDTKRHEGLKLQVRRPEEEDAKGRSVFAQIQGENVPA